MGYKRERRRKRKKKRPIGKQVSRYQFHLLVFRASYNRKEFHCITFLVEIQWFSSFSSFKKYFPLFIKTSLVPELQNRKIQSFSLTGLLKNGEDGKKKAKKFKYWFENRITAEHQKKAKSKKWNKTIKNIRMEINSWFFGSLCNLDV